MWLARVEYLYDTRGRLIYERRDGPHPYELFYEYDAGGNRLRKIDLLRGREVWYHYDLEDPATYGGPKNRLVAAEV